MLLVRRLPLPAFGLAGLDAEGASRIQPATCKQSAQTAAASLLARVSPTNMVGSSLVPCNFSLCYDHIDPQLICESMEQLGIPADLAQLLSNVWTNIRRFVIFDGECSLTAYEAGQMIMQGDSFGPFALHLLMAAGTKWVQKRLPQGAETATPPNPRDFIILDKMDSPGRLNPPIVRTTASTNRKAIHQAPTPNRATKGPKKTIATINGKTPPSWEVLVYMDDRNLTATCPYALCKLVQLWQKWSDYMGLLENAKKTKLVCSNPKKEKQTHHGCGHL